MRRTEQRRAAVIAAYQHDLTGRPLERDARAAAPAPSRARSRSAAVERAPELDELIGRHAHGWTVARIAPLERAILRVALVEMLHGDDVPGGRRRSPPEGAIDEAVETAKLFCAADAAGLRQRRARRDPPRGARE